MEHAFLLYWRRENGDDGGTPVGLQDLDPVLRPRVLDLADEIAQDESGGGHRPIEIHLPFLDQRAWRRRSETLRGVVLERSGHVIRPVHASFTGALRDLAAEAVAGHPAWIAAPVGTERGSFPAWRSVSVAVQEFLHRSAPAIYFRDPAAYEDRPAAWPLLVYQALRPCHGVPETEFTYDIGEPGVLEEALQYVRRPLRDILAAVQTRLVESGRPELSRRYAPLWHEDILRAVQKKPRRLLGLLGDEAMLVDAVIGLGMSRSTAMVKAFTGRVLTTLRSFYDRDMRELAAPMLAEATRALEIAKEAAPPCQQRASAPRKRARRTTSSLPREASDPWFGEADTSGRYMPESAVFL